MSTPDLSSLSPPAGLPDVATLARLAGEFFSAPPGAPAHAPSLPGTPTPPALGGSPLPSNPQPPGLSIPPGVTGPSTPSAVPFGAIPPGANLVPTSPQSPANAVASAPSLVPHAQAPNGVPDHALVAAPGFDGRSGSHLQGVPEAQAARGPADVPSPSGAAVSASPFYFLSDTGVPGATASALPANDRVGARPFGLPGDEALRGLLSSGARPTAAPSGFYFIEPSASANPGGRGVPQAATSAHPPFDVNAIRRDLDRKSVV